MSDSRLNSKRSLDSKDDEENSQQNNVALKPLIREKFLLEIPIVSDSISDFISHFLWSEVTKAIIFIETTLSRHFNIKAEMDFSFIESEIIKNAFDSYAQAETGLIPGKTFKLEIVIKEKNQKIMINTKDNGRGFDNQPKGLYFKREDVKFKTKAENLLGGVQLGLKLSERNLLRNKASLFFKNRKNGGATVSIQLNVPTGEMHAHKRQRPGS